VPARSGLTAGQIAELVGGKLIGPDDVVLAGVAPLEGAGPGDIAFLVSARYRSYLAGSAAGAVLLAPSFQNEPAGPATRIIVDDPQQAAVRVLRELHPAARPVWGVHETASLGRGSVWSGRISLGAGARIGRGVRIGADCVLGEQTVIEDGVILGDACRVEPHAVVHSGAVLGDRVLVRTGARVGGKGFGFTAGPSGHEPIPQVGRCIIGSDVEIGANSTVDRGSLGDTVVGAGTKIDNLVQVAHNVHIGEHCIVMAQVGIAGSTVVEDGVLLAGQAGLADHLTVGRGARVAAQSGVIGDIEPGATVSGYPARSHRSVLRQTAALARLAPLVEALERLIPRDDS
jgi:UDP-3-O-[3-hydroxymyristoyl] glucosamine N-acyltransferase